MKNTLAMNAQSVLLNLPSSNLKQVVLLSNGGSRFPQRSLVVLTNYLKPAVLSTAMTAKTGFAPNPSC